MEPENLTVRVLMDIRDEMRGMRADLSEVKGELVEVKGELVDMKDELVHVNERLGKLDTTVADMSAQVHFIGRSMGVLRASKRGHQKRLDELERRVGDLEKHRP